LRAGFLLQYHSVGIDYQYRGWAALEGEGYALMRICLTLGNALCGFSLIVLSTACVAETIVMVRHAEKPSGGLGQLSCQGLNRSLALPEVLLGKFGKPAAIFAPSPGIQKADQGQKYNYIRPLATIEPTAIRSGMPVNTQWGFTDIDSLKAALLSKDFQNKTVFVAWEHQLLEQLARDIVSQLGADATVVPTWDSKDFDSIYVIDITQDSDSNKYVSFHTDHQNLNGLSTQCPER
jgi:hypothetical protein